LIIIILLMLNATICDIPVEQWLKGLYVMEIRVIRENNQPVSSYSRTLSYIDSMAQ